MEKTYVFDTNSNGSFDQSALIASLLGNKGVDPNLVALMNNACRNQDSWGGGMWWIWVIIMFWLWGGNGTAFGRNHNLDGIPAQLNNDFGRDILLQAINGNANAISQLASTLNCDVKALQGALNQVQSAVQTGNCQLANQMSQCCCDLKNSITTINYENQISNLNQTNQLQASINNVNTSVERGFSTTAFETASQTCELKNAIAAQTQVINDKFCQLEMREMARENRTLRDQVQAYQLSASQQAQTANIVSQIRPCPTPAYVVPNPYGCGCNNFGYPINNGCNC